MSRQYHYLIAGLPDLLFDDSKVQMNLSELKDAMLESLSESDLKLIQVYFSRYDNLNVLERLRDPECELIEGGNLSGEQIEELFLAAKEGSYPESHSGIPDYLSEFVIAFRNDEPLFEGKSWEVQLSEMYYRYALETKNKFIRKWFWFEQTMANILTAAECRKHNIPIENQLTGTGEIVEKLSRSNARDFGLDSEFPFLEEIIKVTEIDDLKEFEKKYDRIKWDYLDEEEFFYYFSIERVFSYLIKLSIIERWLSLDKETGQQLFNELLSNMEASYEFPEEFTLKK